VVIPATTLLTKGNLRRASKLWGWDSRKKKGSGTEKEKRKGEKKENVQQEYLKSTQPLSRRKEMALGKKDGTGKL